MKKTREKRSLGDDELVTERVVGRRSSLAMLGGAILGTAGVVGAGAQNAQAQVTDRDGSDTAGRGRGCPGWSDSDREPSADPAGCGRRTGLTDDDPSDGAARGRGRGSCSDADPYDRPGRGRRC